MKKKLFVGIDNGLSGSISAIDEDQNIVFKIVMPIIKASKSKNTYDIPEIMRLFKELNSEYNMYVVLEKAFVKGTFSGRVACFSTGYCYGIMQGILSALEVSYEIVAPQTWQNTLFKGISSKDTKQASLLYCQRKFPGEVFIASERSSKNHDGITDALCMSVYSWRLNNAK